MKLNNKKRIPNFEIMRTIAMFFIVLWHCCVHGLSDGGGILTLLRHLGCLIAMLPFSYVV